MWYTMSQMEADQSLFKLEVFSKDIPALFYDIVVEQRTKWPWGVSGITLVSCTYPMVCMVSGVLFQGWDVGTLGNTLSGCVTQQHLRVDASEAFAIHPTYTDVCVRACGMWTHVVCIHKAHFPSSPRLAVSWARLSRGVWCETTCTHSAQLFCLLLL